MASTAWTRARVALVVSSLAVLAGCTAAGEPAAQLSARPPQAGTEAVFAAAQGAPAPEAPEAIVTPTTAAARATVAAPASSGIPPADRPGSGGEPLVPPPTVTTTTFPRRPPPPGVQTIGGGGLGWSKSASSGGTSMTFQVYPADSYFDEGVNFGAQVDYTGGVKLVTLDFGDGTRHIGPPEGIGICVYPIPHKTLWLINSVGHKYAAPGTYTATATITTVDCLPAPNWALPPNPLTGPNGEPIGYGPWGAETTVTASLTVLVRPERLPPPLYPGPNERVAS